MMYPLTNMLAVKTTGQELVQQVKSTLGQQGWQVVQSFDLQTARHSHTGCSCPHHGTDQCTCQMAVFLIYGEASSPLTLIAHGRDGRTQLSLVDDPARAANQSLAYRVWQAINHALGMVDE